MHFPGGGDGGEKENERDSVSDGRNSIGTRRGKVRGVHGATSSGRPWGRRQPGRARLGNEQRCPPTEAFVLRGVEGNAAIKVQATGDRC